MVAGLLHDHFPNATIQADQVVGSNFLFSQHLQQAQIPGTSQYETLSSESKDHWDFVLFQVCSFSDSLQSRILLQHSSSLDDGCPARNAISASAMQLMMLASSRLRPDVVHAQTFAQQVRYADLVVMRRPRLEDLSVQGIVSAGGARLGTLTARAWVLRGWLQPISALIGWTWVCVGQHQWSV